MATKKNVPSIHDYASLHFSEDLKNWKKAIREENESATKGFEAVLRKDLGRVFEQKEVNNYLEKAKQKTEEAAFKKKHAIEI